MEPAGVRPAIVVDSAEIDRELFRLLGAPPPPVDLVRPELERAIKDAAFELAGLQESFTRKQYQRAVTSLTNLESSVLDHLEDVRGQLAELGPVLANLSYVIACLQMIADDPALIHDANGSGLDLTMPDIETPKLEFAARGICGNIDMVAARLNALDIAGMQAWPPAGVQQWADTMLRSVSDVRERIHSFIDGDGKIYEGIDEMRIYLEELLPQVQLRLTSLRPNA